MVPASPYLGQKRRHSPPQEKTFSSRPLVIIIKESQKTESLEITSRKKCIAPLSLSLTPSTQGHRERNVGENHLLFGFLKITVRSIFLREGEGVSAIFCLGFLFFVLLLLLFAPLLRNRSESSTFFRFSHLFRHITRESWHNLSIFFFLLSVPLFINT